VTLSRQSTIDWSGKINTQTKSFAQFVAVSRPVTSPTFSTTIDFMLVKMAFKAQNLKHYVKNSILVWERVIFG
jgi:hypothetical protein